MVHLAETEEQARQEVEFGITPFFRYFQQVAAFPQMAVEGENFEEMIEFVNGNGLGVIGTPEMLVDLLFKWQRQSGGFGTCMLMQHEWANTEATRRSHELLARYVMPEFDGQAASQRAAKDHASALRPDLVTKSRVAVDEMTKRYQAELDAKG
jgi:limonene 1,2-monooxygenase